MINGIITILNRTGSSFCLYASTMLVQSSVLIVVLFMIDLLLRKRIRAVFRYCMWMLVFIKLILPPTLCLPTGIGCWCGDYLSADSPVLKKVSNLAPIGFGKTVMPQDSVTPPGLPQVQPAQSIAEAAAPVTSVVSTLPAVTGQAVVFLIWLIGVFVLSLLLIQRVWFVRGLIRQSESAKGRLIDTLNESRSCVGIQKNVELRVSHNTQSPAACGLFKPKILLPASLLAQLPREQLRVVLIHELAHVKRGDLWVSLVQTVLQIVYFYNPLLWLANAAVRRVREQAVDEMVLASLGKRAKVYTNTLIDIAEIAFARPSLSLRLIGVVESKKALIRRIKHIINQPFPKSAKLGAVGWLAVIVTAAILLPMARAEKENIQDQSGISTRAHETAEPAAIGIFDAVQGFVTDKLGKPCSDVLVAPSLADLHDAVKTDENGEFALEDVKPEQKMWIAYSQALRAMAIFTIPENYIGGHLNVVLNFREAHIKGRIINQRGKGLANRPVEFIVNTQQGLTYCLQCDGRTDRLGNYRSRVPCGSGMTIRARLADATEAEREYITKPVTLRDNQTFIPMPILVVWPERDKRF